MIDLVTKPKRRERAPPDPTNYRLPLKYSSWARTGAFGGALDTRIDADVDAIDDGPHDVGLSGGLNTQLIQDLPDLSESMLSILSILGVPVADLSQVWRASTRAQESSLWSVIVPSRRLRRASRSRCHLFLNQTRATVITPGSAGKPGTTRAHAWRKIRLRPPHVADQTDPCPSVR